MSDNGGNERDSDDSDDSATSDDRAAGGRPEASSDQLPATGVSLSLDATLELLAHYDRRAILGYLRDTSDDTATIDELVDHLVAKKTEQTGEQPGRDHVLSTLHHVHVPKLADAGVIDYDARNKEIRYWGSDRLEEWYDRIRNQKDG
ncbi:DUF7344 domain-containing protein [Halorussus salinisoli]|uniref:DUF7344 domain-containing protein n=1 Tax=Halorussus salinisoli TaxID=2558242 RepID=UPI0010C1F5A7|nr:ArsR family transcriptional regulator [Halorussus salinisoli]